MILFLACAGAPVDGVPVDRDSLRLRWLQGYPGETWVIAQEGLWWALSDLGAVPGDGALRVVQARRDEVVFDLDLSALGLPDGALEPARAELAGSAEAEAHGAVDLGRFLLRTLYEPWRYYAITGACLSRPEPVDAEHYAVTTSLLLAGDRLVRYTANPATLEAVLFVVGEGEGDIAEGTFVATEHETVSLMANGQFRYAVYDESGALVPAATAGPAGQPGKCRWCHEYRLQTGTPDNESAEGYVDYARFSEQVAVATARSDEARAQVPGVAWPGDVAHDRAEWLAEAFMWPDAARVALEYGDIDLDGLSSTDLVEYGWTDRYRRADIDARAPFAVVPVVEDTREGGGDYVEAEVLGCGE
ncbi:MAG: hypothetical protein FJ090_11535 [Deltaproteobacteria bacterium]|nr:hypothetical protein [Deltaproteobacteria bacterium]